MQLEGLEADIHAELDMALVVVERRPSHGRGVGRHLGIVPAEQLIDRQARGLRLHVPAQDIDNAERAHVNFLDAIDFPDEVPHPLRHQRVLADEGVEPPVHEVEHRGAAILLHRANMACIGLHADHGLARAITRRDIAMRTRQAVSPEELRTGVVLHEPAGKAGDLHAVSQTII